MNTFSEYIVYVDESGDHNLAKPDPEFPVFVLAFCIFRKDEYISQVVPALQRIKFKHWGHDMVVLHERDIRKASDQFAFLTDATRRTDFMTDLNDWVVQSPFTIIASVILKAGFADKHSESGNPYHFAMQLGLERVEKFLQRREESGEKLVHFVFEARGKREDGDLELEFRRVCDGTNYAKMRLRFEIVFAGKKVNSTGLQLADLTARPIGRYVLAPRQPNRAYKIIETKLDRKPGTNEVNGYGMKTYP